MVDRPDVLFIVLDSLRRDHVSTYGYDRPTTPTLDRFAETATRYDNAFVPAPWTLPSHCSMFTGQAPAEHGITNGFTDRNLRLPDDIQTATERLAADGYQSGGFSNNPWIGQLSALTRGFHQFVEWDLKTSRGRPSRNRDRAYDRLHPLLGSAIQQPLVLLKRRFFTKNLIQRASQWATTGPRPRFTFLNLMEAHSPYYPPKWAFEELGLSAPNPVTARLLNTKQLAATMGKRALDADDQQRIHDFLDASARFQDQQLDFLLTALRDSDRYEDSLIVICADHGKTLGEFDRDSDPPHYLRDINIHVPLLIKWPGQTEPAVVDEPVELTALSEVLANPSEGQKRGETELTSSDGYAYIEDYIPHTGSEVTDVNKWKAIADGELTYVRGPSDSEYVLRGTGTEETVVPLADIESQTRDRLREALSTREAALDGDRPSPDAADEAIDSHLESQLEDLGYLN